jgi:hypothetical protein
MTNLITDNPFDFWNRLANQTITISSLLGGFKKKWGGLQRELEF